jgi:hypothetical protein
MPQNNRDDRWRLGPRLRRTAWAVGLLSVVTLVATVLAGVSFVRRDSVVWGHSDGIYTLQLDRGSLVFFDYTRPRLARSPLRWTAIDAGSGPRAGDRGMGFLYKPWSAADPISFVGVPLWIAIVPLALADVLCIRAWRRLRNRAAHGLGARCGYDVRASPCACPECGLHLSTADRISAA